MTVYFDDLPDDEKVFLRARYEQELRALDDIAYPFDATFGEKIVKVLGPCHRFPPYDDPVYGVPTWRSNIQQMCEEANGDGFITFATALYVDGKALVTKTPPWRPRLQRWERELLSRQGRPETE